MNCLGLVDRERIILIQLARGHNGMKLLSDFGLGNGPFLRRLKMFRLIESQRKTVYYEPVNGYIPLDHVKITAKGREYIKRF